MEEVDGFVKNLDIDYSYRFARNMEKYKSNEKLGFRTAGSAAEYKTGEMIFQEMKNIGLSNVHKDKIEVDAWDFKKAQMQYTDLEGRKHDFVLGAYQTDFHTGWRKKYKLVYLGNGNADSYQNIDVTGKLVLVDIDQRDEWWINFPVYQAHLKGAAALLAVQKSGYGEIHDTSLNTQDIAGPADAAAFSISQADAWILKKDLEKMGEIEVDFDADSTVLENQHSYNIIGEIAGKNPQAKILLSAHYDSYYNGFQDDNTAVSMMLGIADAWIKTGYVPEKTWVFVAMAAEEWGIVNSKYDWSTGAYEQVFSARPEWREQTFADLNFELPAYAHCINDSKHQKDAIRCTYEYKDFVENFLKEIKVDEKAYPDGIEARCPIETWSDDFSMAISGIPSFVNNFSEGSFMETHYHSQFDSELYYQEPVYRFHHELYGKLLYEIDRLCYVPLNFTNVFEKLKDSLNIELCQKTGADVKRLNTLINDAVKKSSKLYSMILAENEKQGQVDCEKQNRINKMLLNIFKKTQDYFVRLTWQDEVIFPQEAVQNNLYAVEQALMYLNSGKRYDALQSLYDIDNNQYAFQFDRNVYEYFTDYVLKQPASRLKWGQGRIIHHENLFDLVSKLKQACASKENSISEEIDILKEVKQRQEQFYREDIDYLIRSVEKIEILLDEVMVCYEIG